MSCAAPTPPQFYAGVSLQALIALLGHVLAEMSLRYGRLFDATVRTEYERALTLAKANLGPLPQGRASAAHRRHPRPLARHPDDQSPLGGGFYTRGPESCLSGSRR